MPRYDDRHGCSCLYVGHLSSRTRTRDLEDLFGHYGRCQPFRSFCDDDGLTVYGNHLRRVRDVHMKRDYAFVEFSDPRDADDARYILNGQYLDASRITVEFSRGAPRGPGGSLDFGAKGPVPGTGRCFNCGIVGHWARDCKAGDLKNKCYRCGERGHIVRNCQNSPMKLKRGRSYSRSPSPRRGRRRSHSLSRIHSRSRSSRKRERVLEHSDRFRSPVRSKSPRRLSRRSRSSPRDVGRHTNGSDYGRCWSSVEDVGRESPRKREDNSSMKANGGGDHSLSPLPGK